MAHACDPRASLLTVMASRRDTFHCLRGLDHLTFEINSVTSEEDLVTEVTEESDHKTLKTNKQALKTDAADSESKCPGFTASTYCLMCCEDNAHRTQVAPGVTPRMSPAVWVGAHVH